MIEISDRVKYLNYMLCEVEKIYQSLLASQKISDSEYVLLFAILEKGEGCLQKEIVQSSYISKKTLNSTVKKLEQKGLITLKSGKYPNMHIYLTDKGKEYLETKIIPILKIQENMMQNVSDEDFGKITAVVPKYLKIFSK